MDEIRAESVTPIRATPIGDDESTFAAIYPMLRRFAAAVAGTGVDPDDLVHDALVRVLRRGGLAQLESPEAYLRRVILNLALDDKRSFRRRTRALARLRPSRSVAPDYPSDLDELDRLDPTDRAVLYLADVQGMPLSDVADLVSLSYQAVRTRASRSRSLLRAALADQEALG